MNSKFDAATSVWFGSIASRSAKLAKHKTFEKLNDLFNPFKIPNKRRLLQLIEMARISRKPEWQAVVRQASAILAGEYSEFRFRYNRVSPLKGQCSATSAFFSSLRQALNYNV